MTKPLITIEMSGASQDEVMIEPSDLKLFKGFAAPTDGTVKLELENETAATAFGHALKWARREASLQKMIQSRDEFVAMALLAQQYDIELLKDDLGVCFTKQLSSRAESYMGCRHGIKPT